MSNAVTTAAVPVATMGGAAGELGGIVSMIERAARDPAVDLTKMERLFEMHQAAERRRAETAYNAAMAKAQAEIKAAVRNRLNTHTHSAYADLYAISEAAGPAIAGNGFGLSFGHGKATQPGSVLVYLDIVHAEGFSKRYEGEFPLDAAGAQGKTNKTPIQAQISTTTYARRALQIMAFNIPVRDQDGNAPTPPTGPTISDEQAVAIRDWMEATDVTAAVFCAHFKIAAIEDLPASKYAAAIRGFEAHKRRQAAT